MLRMTGIALRFVLEWLGEHVAGWIGAVTVKAVTFGRCDPDSDGPLSLITGVAVLIAIALGISYLDRF